MNKNYVYKRRLLSLAYLLEKLPPERFNYRTWVGGNWKGKPDLSCGTTACALGWATTIPALRRKGLRLQSRPNEMAFVCLKEDNIDPIDAPSRAGSEIFGLNEDEFEYLFVPHSGIELQKLGLNETSLPYSATAKRVAKHIRQFVAAKYNRAKAR